MMKILIPIFCAVLFSSSVATQNRTIPVKIEAKQSKLTPRDVIDNYLKALGGRDKLEAVKSTLTEAVVLIQDKNNKMAITASTKRMGNKFKFEQYVSGKPFTQVFDGERGYAGKGNRKIDFPADKIAEMKKGKTIEALQFDPSSFKAIVVEKVDGKDYNVLTSDKGSFYFDASTGLLYKSILKEGNAVIKKYMTVDGIKFPSEIEVEGDGQKVVSTTINLVLNRAFTDADFK
ncbi:hypothetical protein A0O34_13425 [Chryseobacterium glaciei]|uniref:Outer membrane lipoprotein carrier protein LolA n=1 Tax=Chryseobacterium glaciei TaxID=1685010 RepID=A0A172XWX0_9FLAO|nr:hypothetical protein [Chryseobacterium glaciei]ANF51444.1 hypothetical protein A0O34_13425 [Chryseobacterium glaciei]